MDTQKIEIRITSVLAPKNQDFIRVFEGNFDPDTVEIQRRDLAIRSLYPLQFFVEGVAVNIFSEYVIKHLLNPIVERLDWKRAVRRYLSPYQPFSLIVNLRDDNITIEHKSTLNRKHIEDIWENISKVLEILQSRNLMEHTTKIRFVSNEPDDLTVICYEGSKPSFLIEMDAGRIISIPDSETGKYEEAQDFVTRELRKAEEYERRVTQFEDEQTREDIIADDNDEAADNAT